MEARQASWKEDMETKQIELLEKEEQLRKMHEGLESQQQAMHALTRLALKVDRDRPMKT